MYESLNIYSFFPTRSLDIYKYNRTVMTADAPLSLFNRITIMGYVNAADVLRVQSASSQYMLCIQQGLEKEEDRHFYAMRRRCLCLFDFPSTYIKIFPHISFFPPCKVCSKINLKCEGTKLFKLFAFKFIKIPNN